MELIFERVFHFLFSVTNSYGWAILLISVLISAILMPFYHITNILEGREKTIHLKLQPYISRINKIKNAHIKHKHLSKLYKSYNYSPIMSLRSLSSLIIQVPFFIVAYQTLSKILIANPYNSENMSFLFIKNLVLQDNLMGGVNLLPILMTLINILAVMCMTSFPKERRKSYAIAVFFLIFLYMSPAGLVLYWTSNNLINLFRYLFAYLKDKKLPAIKHILISYLPHLLKSADVRAFLLLITIYFIANAKANNIAYNNIMVIPWYILFVLKLYDYKIMKPYMTKNVKIQLSLVILCLAVSCFVKRWEKTHWLFAALTLFTMYNYKSIKLVKIKKILKSLALPVVGMLFPAVLYVKANAIYINGYGYISYFSILILIACFIPPVVYVCNTNYSISKIIKISLSFILAAMLPPLIRSVIKYTGSYPCDFIFLLFILYFIIDLFWKKKKVIIIFLLSATLFSVFYKINLNSDKDADGVAAQVPEELLAIPMKDTPTVYLFMYDSFPHKELINRLGLDRSGLDALLREYQFKEYDVYSLAYHTLATMAKVFNIQKDDMDNSVCRKVIVGNNLVSAVFKRHGYNNFVSADDDSWAFPNITYFKNYNIISNMHKNKSSVDFAFSLSVIRSIIKGDLNTGVLSLEEGNNCFKLAKFANRGKHERTFAWGMTDFPGHSTISGKGFEHEFKRWESRYYVSIENMKRDMKLAISNNPSAIVILMSDHGPVLLDDASRGYPSLKDDQIKSIHFRDMFGAFMAVRWPDKERAAKYDKEFNITQDVFPIVFAYLCDSPIPLKYKIKDTAIRIYGHRNHKFDKGVFYSNSYEEEK